ncbi:MAG TPA: biopolymer transporter ExbD [Cytophagaceae bacterium]
MPKVKVPRKSVSLDMTAMCDMAFLLLTFFMLTTQFKPQEPIAVDMPASVSELLLPDTDVLIISVAKTGEVYFGLDGQHTKKKLLEKISEKYGLSFTPHETNEFLLLPSFGVPVGGLKKLLNMSNEERNLWKQPGIPVDSTNNELYDLIVFSRMSNPKLRIAIKGDRNTNYEVISKVIGTLQDQNINKINLITSLQNKPKL